MSAIRARFARRSVRAAPLRPGALLPLLSLAVACLAAAAEPIEATGALDLDVSPPSRRNEAARRAAAIVSLMDAEEIRAYGARNLLDLLRRMPGLLPLGASLERDAATSIRGQHSGAVDRRILILIDGRPLRDAHAGGIDTAFYRAFPIAAIERIELTRGPTPVLRGDGAFSGVIDVITKEAAREPEMEAAFGGGSFDTLEGDFALRGRGHDFRGGLALQIADARGWPLRAFDAAGTHGSERYGTSDRSAVGRLHFRDLSLTGYVAESEDETLGLDGTWPFEGYLKQRLFLDAGYRQPLPLGYGAELHVTHNAARDETDGGSIRVDSSSTLFDLVLRGSPVPRLGVIAGTTIELLRGESLAGAGVAFASERYSAHLQADYAFWRDLRAVAGLRFVHASVGGNDVSTHLGLVANPFEHWGAKALYAEAVRLPYPLEREIGVPGMAAGNPDLSAEKIRSVSLQIFHDAARTHAAATLFYAEIRDAIVIETRGQPGYFNAGELESLGFELEGEVRISPALSLQGSFSHQSTLHSRATFSSRLVPSTTLKLGLAYRSERGIRAGLFNSYFSAPSNLGDLVPTQVVQNEGSGAYHHLSFHLEIDVREALRQPRWPDLTLSFFADNLLESSPVVWPDQSRGDLDNLPALAGRAFYGRIRARY